MPTLILLCGITAVSWKAWLAFRTRVSMSAIGSVMVIAFGTSFSRGFPFGTYNVGLGAPAAEQTIEARFDGPAGHSSMMFARRSEATSNTPAEQGHQEDLVMP